MVTINEVNDLYEMYIGKSKEELAMILVMNAMLEDMGQYAKNPVLKIKDKEPVDFVDLMRDAHKRPITTSDPDMFRVHPEDGPIYQDPTIVTTPMINDDDFCWWTKDNRCVRGSNKCCDGCCHFPRTYVTCGDNTSISNTDSTLGPNPYTVTC